MDDVAELIQTTEVPLYGICFGHQIICKALGGKVTRALKIPLLSQMSHTTER